MVAQPLERKCVESMGILGCPMHSMHGEVTTRIKSFLYS